MRHRLRIVRMPAERLGDPEQAVRIHGELDEVIRRHLPAANASLLAFPSVSGPSVDWLSDLAGHPRSLTTLSGDERQRVEVLLAERLAALNGLADRLEGAGRTDLATALRKAAQQPAPEDVYAVSGQPVILCWGLSAIASSPSVSGGNMAAVSAAAMVPGQAIGGSGGDASPEEPRSNWWRWLLALLLVAMVVAALLMLRGCDDDPSAKSDAVDASPALGEPDDLAALLAEEQELRRQALLLQDELRRRLEACASPGDVPDGSTKVTVPEAKSAPASESPKPQAPAEPQPQAPAEPKPQSPKQAATPAPSPAKSPCPPSRPKWEAPEVVMLLDASGSMGMPTDVDDAAIDALYKRAARGDAQAIARLKALQARQGASRLDVAKEAIKTTVQNMPSDVDVGLVVFGKCQGADSHKFFSASDRPTLFGVVDGIRAQDGTPLARGLERAANMMDATDIAGTIVLLTDGRDSCDGDPCAAARALKAKKPMLKVNVIDASGSGAARCIAEATGGQVFTPSGAKDMMMAVQRGTEQPPVSADCRQ